VDLGIHCDLGSSIQMPLFFTHYSYLGFDPNSLVFKGKSYFEHFQDLCRVQVVYAKSKSGVFKGYGPLWGITACKGPDRYRAFAPDRDDNGTLAPTAALSSMPYVPEESRSFLREMNLHHRDLWGLYGFRDSFNLSRDWAATDYLGIDVGPIAPMIENHRSGLCWKTFMQSPEIAVALRRILESEPPQYR